MRKKAQVLILVLWIAIPLGTVVWWLADADHIQIVEKGIHWLREQEAMAGVIFLGMYIASCVFLLPGFWLTAGAGALFGLTRGIIYVSLGATLGATAAFLVGRYFGKQFIQNRLKETKTFKTIDRLMLDEGLKVLILSRLCTFVPFRLSNYAFAVTPVSLSQFTLGTWLGTLPGVIVYVYLGYAAGKILIGNDSPNIFWYTLPIGVLTLLLLLFLISRAAKRALLEH